MMKNIQQANVNLLHLLFDWKRKEGKIVRFSIDSMQERWVLSFYSVDYLDRDKHVFASFIGKNHDELKGWALDCLVNYKIKEQKLPV